MVPRPFTERIEDAQNLWMQSSCRGAAETNPNRNREVAGSIPGLAQWLRICGVALSCGGSQTWLETGVGVAGIGRQLQLRLDP